MNIGQAVLEAFESLAANKLRAGLTILGIVIGVGAVIAMVSVGRGAQATITESINGIGTNLIFVFRGGSEDVRNPKHITLQDAQAIADPFQAPSVSAVAPVIQDSGKVTFGRESTTTSITGVTPEYQSVRKYGLTEGEFINQEQLLGQASVVLLGSEVADKLFGRQEGLIGETVRIEGQPYRVIGVLESKGGSGFSNADNQIMVPFSTAQARLIRHAVTDQVDLLLVEAVSPKAVPAASEEVAQILRTRHRTAIGADDFTILTQQDFLSTASTITNVLTIFLGGVAAISLLVGGIGIMNIMLVSVTERTRESGLRKAVGAHKSDILIQFLAESSVLSLIGGVIGIILGYAIAIVVSQIAKASNANIAPTISLDIILIATLFSTAVGLFFGLYPANRAANLEPVEALRYE
ncbi:MAG: FtsX-like permease family protein [Anaerolineae bacterium]|nr:FtsX-like permease family protein [Anaerolineae bacterium]